MKIVRTPVRKWVTRKAPEHTIMICEGNGGRYLIYYDGVFVSWNTTLAEAEQNCRQRFRYFEQMVNGL